ncbi:hypothetical protein [Nocardioides sp. SYSU D00038]|uniref:hypothetical protein n=1 Tax=Nocardioides sp. SYSU D00038 TaxID=2812554 RepID=UPI00196749CD|nr:hypothetical protein [Nocardioides sp. SYSU D00038]
MSSCDHTCPPRRRRPSFTTVIALLALVLAVSGTSYAAGKINGKNIKANSIAGKKLKNDTVTGAKIKESTLGQVPSAKVADSVKPGAVAADDLAANSIGSAALGTITQRQTTQSVGANSSEFQSTSCQAGEQLISGGAYWELSSGTFTDATSAALDLVYSHPNNTSWVVRGHNGTGNSHTLRVYALCLAP